MAQESAPRMGDWHRILFGEAPPAFLLEVALRTIVVFGALLLLVRLLGKRMNGQLTATEMAVMLTLGAVAANGMQLPQRGILQAIFVLACTFIFQRGLTWLEVKSPRLEAATTGTTSMLVKDGVLQLDELKSTRISRDQIFAILRSKKMVNLGRAKRVYVEGCGIFSIFEEQQDKPGLSILPEVDGAVQGRRRFVANTHACKNCGCTASATNPTCPNCNGTEWDPAVL
jgi:uncharacterized membrane protein YcaP (DUF421 family)